jgi:hypothetical protein
MNTLEFRLSPQRFTRFASANTAAQSALTIDANVPASIGHHILIQEFAANDTFTGRWIRSRIVDVRPSKAGQIVTLAMIARNVADPVRRRAAA